MNKFFKNFIKIKRVIPFLTIFSIFLIYSLNSTNFIPGADSGEFIVLAKNGGIAHPPGYPLLVLFLRAFNSFAPLLGELKSLIFSSILFISISALLLYASLITISKDHFSASISTLAIFLSEIIWNITLSIEPFSLNILQASLLVFLLIKYYYNKISPSFCLLLSYAIFSSGASNHHSLIFFIPIILYLTFSIKNKITNIQFLASISIGIFIGILPLVYLILPKFDNQWVWGDWSNPLERFFIHLFRKEYGSFSLTAGDKGSPYSLPIIYFKYLVNNTTLLSIISIPIIFINKQIRQTIINNKKLFILIFLSFLLSGIFFTLLFRLPLSSFSIYISKRFFALPTILLAFPLFIFLNYFKKKYLFVISSIFITVNIFINTVNYCPNTLLKKHIQNIYSICEYNSILICKNDIDYVTGLQIQYTNNNPKNIIPVYCGLLGMEWYYERVSKKLKLSKKVNSLNELILQIKNGNIYILEIPEGIDDSITKKIIPVGPLLKLNDSCNVTTNSVLNLNQKLISSGKIILPHKNEIITLDTWNKKILSYYTRPWNSIIKNSDSTSDEAINISQNYLKLFTE